LAIAPKTPRQPHPLLKKAIAINLCHNKNISNQATAMTSVLPNILTLEETAAYLRLSPATVAQRAQQGNMPGQYIDNTNTWHFLKSEIDNWQQTHDKRAILLKQAGALADDDTLEHLQLEIDRARQQLTFEADIADRS
jgi:Helix-turn-helix domain